MIYTKKSHQLCFNLYYLQLQLQLQKMLLLLMTLHHQ